MRAAMSTKISRDDVIAGYRLLLKRDPENETVIQVHLGLGTWWKFVSVLMDSEEYKLAHATTKQATAATQIYAGYSAQDLELFKHFTPYRGPGADGFVIDFLGVRTRTTFSAGFSELNGQVLGYPIPMDFHAETIEWIGLLKSIMSATGSVSVLELGAGWGPWLSAAAAAARAKQIGNVRLYGVEADAGHIEFMREHFAANDIGGDMYEIIPAVVGPEAGRCYWPVTPEAAADYGQSAFMFQYAEAYKGRFPGFLEVDVVGINEILGKEKRWDLVHMDIQGSETEVCTAGIAELTRRVRWLVIGTHSRKIEGDLLELFVKAGWILEHEKPTRFAFDALQPALTAMTTFDGAQVWRNDQASW